MSQSNAEVPPRSSRWRRELPPVLVVAGLMSDYLTPSALWTIIPPLVAVLALIALRRWAGAALVVLLSSWVLVPSLAGALCAYDAAQGTQRIYAVGTDGAEGTPGVDTDELSRCYSHDVNVEVLEVSPGFVAGMDKVAARIIESFAEIHNDMALERIRRQPWFECREPGSLNGAW
jgi:hypothetical protein